MRKKARHWDNPLRSMEQAAIANASHIVQQWKEARDAEVNQIGLDRINAMIDNYKEIPIHDCVRKGGDGYTLTKAGKHKYGGEKSRRIKPVVI